MPPRWPPHGGSRRPRARRDGAIATASITPQRQPSLRGPAAAQCRSRPQPIRSSGNGSRTSKVALCEGRHRADLDEGRLAHHARRPPPRDRPGGVGVQPVAGLREAQRETLAEEQEPVEEAAGELDVVIDHEQPVVAGGGCAASSALRFSNLPPPPAGAVMCSSTSWRERSSSARMRCCQAACSGRSTPSASTRRRGGSSRRGPRQAPPAPGERLAAVERPVGRVCARASRARRRSRWRPRGSPPPARAGGGLEAPRGARREGLAQAPRAVSGHRQARRAAAKRSTCPRQPASTFSSEEAERACPRRASKRLAARPRR